MTVRDLFRIIIRIGGLYFFIYAITIFFMSVSFTLKGIIEYLVIIGSLGISIAIIYLLIAKADYIIDFFKLDKNLDNSTISFPNFNTNSVINVVAFLFGGYLILINSAELIIRIITKIKFRKEDEFSSDFSVISLHIILILVGFLLITFRKNITHYFEKNDTKHSS